jgi:hypothetical protein
MLVKEFYFHGFWRGATLENAAIVAAAEKAKNLVSISLKYENGAIVAAAKNGKMQQNACYKNFLAKTCEGQGRPRRPLANLRDASRPTHLA